MTLELFLILHLIWLLICTIILVYIVIFRRNDYDTMEKLQVAAGGPIVFILYIIYKTLQLLVKEYKKVDRRSPHEIELIDRQAKRKAEEDEIRGLLRIQERYGLVETNRHKFTLYDTKKEELMVDLSFTEAKYILSLP